MITAERLREQLDYEPDTGVFRWKVAASSRVSVGKVAGHETKQRYISIYIDGKNYLAHRLAWMYANGSLPTGELDHANGVSTDNRLTNLRPASRSQNLGNARRRKDNTSGAKGVSWHRQASKWQAKIQKDGVTLSLGLFSDKVAAASAYYHAATRHFGDFARVE